MSDSIKAGDVSLALKVLKSDPHTAWEHQERAVYTVEAMEKEIRELLSPKKQELTRKELLSKER
jgi:hypothetical protein